MFCVIELTADAISNIVKKLRHLKNCKVILTPYITTNNIRLDGRPDEIMVV